jgi:RNA polymerase sigma-70 factor (ECF subfamily)
VEEVFDATEPFLEVSERLMQAEIDRAIDSLPVMERTAVELHYIQGLSYQEMSEVLECPTGTIKARVHNAISRLRQKLSRLMEVDER